MAAQVSSSTLTVTCLLYLDYTHLTIDYAHGTEPLFDQLGICRLRSIKHSVLADMYHMVQWRSDFQSGLTGLKGEERISESSSNPVFPGSNT